MDISTIQMHLDNFVNTWNGWDKVVDGLKEFQGIKGTASDFYNTIVRSFDQFSALSSTLSSK